MIRVNYRERICNRLFQYCMGRILAQSFAYKLDADPIAGFDLDVRIPGESHDKPVVCFQAGRPGVSEYLDIEAVRKCLPAKIVLDSFFQDYRNYKGWKKNIRDWVGLPDSDAVEPFDETNKETVYVHVRLGDYVDAGLVVDPVYYHKALATLSFSRLVIFSDQPQHDYIEQTFKRYGAADIFGCSWQTAFVTMASCPMLVTGNSTFSWWAGFLNPGAKAICMPWNYSKFWGDNRPGGKLKVDDMPNWRVIEP